MVTDRVPPGAQRMMLRLCDLLMVATCLIIFQASYSL
nr:C4-dicarboxylate ABC transporter [Candidatus Pantoea persica]